MRRENYGLRGPEGFSDEGLVALVLGVEEQDAGEVVQRFGSLAGLADAQPLALVGPGIGQARAVRLHAALALARRLQSPSTSARQRVTTPEQALGWLRPAMAGLLVEELHALYLDRRRNVVACRRLSRGSDGFTVVDPRQVFRPAVHLGAQAVVLAHNHPSGDPSPSPQDIDITQRLVAAGTVLGVSLLDHLVLGGERYVSMAAMGEVPMRHPSGPDWLDGPS